MGERVFSEPRRQVTLERDAQGVVHVRATRLEDAYFGLGYAHAFDRGLQMVLLRILGQGRGSELLDPSEEMLRVDTFFRRMAWFRGAEAEPPRLSKVAHREVEAYVEGVNVALARHRPWELRALGHRPEPWRLEDSILLARMIGYVSLAQSQAEVERLFVQLVAAGVPRAHLEALFPDAIDPYDEALLRQVRLGERIVPPGVLFGGIVPKFLASNNWVISGSRTASGRPILANDPHLEVNRLPAVWYEAALSVSGRWAIGATMPGLPAILIGRNNDLAWGATYAFMDSVDSWIEHVKDGLHRTNKGWAPFRRRVEIIRRRGKPPVERVFWENDHGTLDGAPGPEAYQLATLWSGARAGARSLEAAMGLWHASSVEAGMRSIGRLESSFNWVLADRSGGIGYQMSGLAPRRRSGWRGFVPVPGWDPENDWRGFYEPEDLPRTVDPEGGFFATANDDLNAFGRVPVSNLVMGSDRAQRIREMLAKRTGWTVEDCRKLQGDLHSKQAERFLAILRPLLPATAAGRELATWDLRYDAGSVGASRFEAFYAELRAEVFGRHGFGDAVVQYLSAETCIFTDFFATFDRVLLSERSVWFGDETREALYRRAAERALQGPARPWGESQVIGLNHLLLGGRLPPLFGFDRGPIVLEGGRATIHQGQIYRSGGRLTTFAPSYRFVTDLAEDVCFTVVPGGPSDRRFSPWYASDLDRWVSGHLKIVRPEL